MYSTSRSLSIKLEASPSLLFNNLSASRSSSFIAYAHRDSVHLVDVKSLDGRASAPPMRKLPLPEAAGLVTQVAWLDFGARSVLGVTTRSILFVFASDCITLLLRQPLSPLAAATGIPPEHVAHHFFRGLAAVPHSDAVVVGTSWGDAYVFPAAGGGAIPAFSADGTPRLTGQHAAPITCATADEHFIVTADDTGTLVQWAAAGLAPLARHELGAASGAAAAVPCSSIGIRSGVIVAGFCDGRIRVYSAGRQPEGGSSGAAETRPASLDVEADAHSRCVTALAWHPGQPIFASAGEDGALLVWSLTGLEASGGSAGGGAGGRPRARLQLDFSARLPDSMPAGVQFLPVASLARSSAHLVATAYEQAALKVFLGI